MLLWLYLKGTRLDDPQWFKGFSKGPGAKCEVAVLWCWVFRVWALGLGAYGLWLDKTLNPMRFEVKVLKTYNSSVSWHKSVGECTDSKELWM